MHSTAQHTHSTHLDGLEAVGRLDLALEDKVPHLLSLGLVVVVFWGKKGAHCRLPTSAPHAAHYKQARGIIVIILIITNHQAPPHTPPTCSSRASAAMTGALLACTMRDCGLCSSARMILM